MGWEFSCRMNDVRPRVGVDVKSKGINVSGRNTACDCDERFKLEFDSVDVFYGDQLLVLLVSDEKVLIDDVRKTWTTSAMM
jgi:hypothetical protein